MIILTSGGSDNIERLIDALDSLREKTGLDIHIRKTKAPLHREAPPSILYKLVAICIDRPGIVHQICKVLHDRKINIEDISTNVDHDLATNASVFQMVCYFSLPPAVKIIDLKNALTRVSDDYNVDIRFDAVIGK
jgi:glycine cleavage system transcriptional repressor